MSIIIPPEMIDENKRVSNRFWIEDDGLDFRKDVESEKKKTGRAIPFCIFPYAVKISTLTIEHKDFLKYNCKEEWIMWKISENSYRPGPCDNCILFRNDLDACKFKLFF